MKVQFQPPQLRSARMAPLLMKILAELAPTNRVGELRVLRNVPQEPLRLVFIGEGQQPSSMSLPSDWLYGEHGEAHVRAQLAQLVTSQPVRN